VKVERMQDQHNSLQHFSGPLPEEALKVIGELGATQGNMKQVAHETKENLTALTVQGVEEIVEIEETIIKEVAIVK
jgi:hypothetical protein